MDATELRTLKVELIKAGMQAKITQMKEVDIDKIEKYYEALRDEQFMLELYSKQQKGEENVG